LDALDNSHTEAAQALTGSLIDSLLTAYFGKYRYKYTPAKNGKRTTEAYQEFTIRQFVAFAPMWQVYQQFWVVVGSRCRRVPVMITFSGQWAWAARFVCLLALEIPAGKQRESAMVRARSSSSDPWGSGLRRSPRAVRPEASAKAGTLRAAARRPQSEGQKAKSDQQSANVMRLRTSCCG
jgi:hypothetical protein